jgi:cytochrome P450
MHRRIDIFGPDAHIFKPSRWESSYPAPWTYLPFNGGPRICIGQIFALVEIQYTVIRIFQEFEGVRNLGALGGREQRELVEINLKPKEKVLCEFWRSWDEEVGQI